MTWFFWMERDIRSNYEYLKAKVSISDPESLKEAVLGRCTQLKIEDMAKDIEPFLVDAFDEKK